jgi:glycosyltransferase involved in cell wall biosynthesis
VAGPARPGRPLTAERPPAGSAGAPGPSDGPVAPELSFVVPLYNESPSLAALYEAVRDVSEGLGRMFEIVFVDDGSTDDSFEVLAKLHAADPRVRVLRFGRNRGKSDALDAGFRAVRGRYVVTMDADLQDDPAEVPRMLEALTAGGYDLVSGWKEVRRDSLSRRAASRLFNWVTARVSGIRLHDFNCGFKLYRREVTDRVRVYGELHRFLPVLAHWNGFKVGELAVRHHPRRFGRSRFGPSRLLKGMFDLTTVMFLVRFERRPLHLFGTIGLLCLLGGGGISLFFVARWLLGETMYVRPIMIAGWVLIVLGVQFVSMGLLGEMLTRGHQERAEVPVRERLG